MSDPIDRLEGLPPESPPREVVLASLRLFRYRALTAILVTAIVVAGLVIAARTVARPQLDEDVRAVLEDSRVEYQPVSGSTRIGPVQVTVTEVASSPMGNVARLLFVDTGSTTPSVDLDVLGIRQGTATLGPIISIQSLGSAEGRTGTAVWVPLDPILDPIGARIDVLALPIPQSVIDEGGELTTDDGFTGVVTIERPSTTP